MSSQAQIQKESIPHEKKKRRKIDYFNRKIRLFNNCRITIVLKYARTTKSLSAPSPR